MMYDQAVRLLKNNKILAEDRSIKYGLNRIRWHNRNETIEHFISKAMLGFLILKNDKCIITEAECRNARQIDILQINKQGELVGYEIENNKNMKSDVESVDMFEIKLKDMPVKAREGMKELEKWLKGYLV